MKSVSDGVLTVQRNGKEEALPFGTCVWATGIAMHPLVRHRARPHTPLLCLPRFWGRAGL